MRVHPTLALATLAALLAASTAGASFVLRPGPADGADVQALAAPSGTDADGQAAVCVVGDAYNTGTLPCRGLVCYGQTQTAWQTCVGSPPCLPPRCHIPPPAGVGGPMAAGAAGDASMEGEQVAICVYGDAYNTGGRPCQGGVCVGYTGGQWVDCYPRVPPCWACPPPPPQRAEPVAMARIA